MYTCNLLMSAISHQSCYALLSTKRLSVVFADMSGSFHHVDFGWGSDSFPHNYRLFRMLCSFSLEYNFTVISKGCVVLSLPNYCSRLLIIGFYFQTGKRNCCHGMTFSCHGVHSMTCTRGWSIPKLSTLDSSGFPSMKFFTSKLTFWEKTVGLCVPAFILS